MAPPPVTSERPMMLGPLHDRLPAEQHLHALEKRADAARALVGQRFVAGEREGELLVLGADPEALARLHAGREPRDEFVARFDRRHIDYVASHQGSRSEKRPATLHGRSERAIRRQACLPAAPGAPGAPAGRVSRVCGNVPGGRVCRRLPGMWKGGCAGGCVRGKSPRAWRARLAKASLGHHFAAGAVQRAGPKDDRCDSAE